MSPLAPYPVGILCSQFMRPAPQTAHNLKVREGDRLTLMAAGVCCGPCGSTRFDVTLFNVPSSLGRFMRNI